jgi:hypothetical protein
MLDGSGSAAVLTCNRRRYFLDPLEAAKFRYIKDGDRSFF